MCVCVYLCVNVVIGRQSDVGAHKGVTLVVPRATDWIELNLLAQLPFLSFPFTEKSNSKAIRQMALCIPVSKSSQLSVKLCLGFHTV